jgi:hypothetical protein
MVIVGLLRASSAPLEWRRHDDVTLSTRRPSSKLSAAFLVKRVRDVKNEPAGKHGCDNTSEQGQKGREQERVGRFGEASRREVRARVRPLRDELVKLQLWVVATPGPALLPVSILHAHKGIVDRGRLIKPMARIAVCGLAARGPAARVEGELVMPHRHYVTLRAFWLEVRVRRRLRGRRNP